MKKKRGLTIKINFSNRWLYTFILLGIIIAVSIGVYAVAVGTKPNPGHLVNEMGVPSNCIANQSIIWNGSDLICGDAQPRGLTYLESTTCPGEGCTAYCPSGQRVIYGGCACGPTFSDTDTLQISYPTRNAEGLATNKINGWYCACTDNTVWAYVVCAY